MKKYPIIMANGTKWEPPLFDPVVAQHYQNPASNVATLMDEINVKEIYAPFFEGKRNLTFLDIGANIGLVSIYAFDACSRIISVEPDPGTFEVLRAMTFSLLPIQRLQAALAPVDGPCEFFRNEKNSTASSTVNTYGRCTEVQGLTLTSILSQNQLEHIDVLKCDAEGSEGESLTLEQLESIKGVVDCLYLECHNCPKSTWEGKMSDIIQSLNILGFRDMRISGMTLIARK